MRGTGVVRESGVDPLADRAADWPEAYRLGIAQGLLLDPGGRLLAQPSFVPVLAAVVAQMAGHDWQQLQDIATGAPLKPVLSADDTRHGDLLAALETAGSVLPEGSKARWELLTRLFRPPAG
jgi:hypothetical protein